MNKFLKFPSVQQDWLSLSFSASDFQLSQFAVTEKIDGANIQLYLEPGKPALVGKRTSFVQRDEEFFNLWRVIDEHEAFIDALAQHAQQTSATLRLFGELFGSEVIKRIDYQTTGSLRFFQMEVDDERLPFCAVEKLLDEIGRPDLLAPLIGVMTLEEAMTLDPVFPSLLNSDEQAEGIVICGYDHVFHGKNSAPFLCKMKNPDFADTEGGDGKNPVYWPVTKYLNGNRLVSVESKHGAFDNLKEMQRYIDLVINEVNEDFEKDHGTPPSPPAEKFKNQIASMIAKYVKSKPG